MTGRASFGDFIAEADRYLDMPFSAPAAPPGDSELDEVASSLARITTVMSRYISDITAASDTTLVRGKQPRTAWARACIEAREAAGNSASFLRHPVMSQDRPGEAFTVSPPARRLNAASASLTIARDLLHTHLTPDGTGQDRSDWAPVITSAPVARALLTEVASWAWRIAPQVADLAAGGRSPYGTGEAGRRLTAAAQWLWVLDASVQAAHRQEPVTEGDRQLLHAIPVNALPARREPDGQTVTGLCEGIISTAERVRHAARMPAAHAHWSPAMTVTSLRQVTAASTVTSHHCQILQQTLASHAEPPELAPGIGPSLLQSAAAAARTRSGWLTTARALRQVTTDVRGYLSPAAAEASDLALWTGRLAYANPRWTLASGPSHTPRPPEALASEPDDIPLIIAAVHHTLDTLNQLASAEQEQIRQAARAGRILVPTRSLPARYDVPRPYAPAPAHRVHALLSAYHDAATASAAATAQIAAIAGTVRAPSTQLTAARAAAGTTSRHRPGTRPPKLTVPGEPRQNPGPVERNLRALGVTSPDLLRRGSAIDIVGQQLITDAADQLAPRLRRHAAPDPGKDQAAPSLTSRDPDKNRDPAPATPGAGIHLHRRVQELEAGS